MRVKLWMTIWLLLFLSSPVGSQEATKRSSHALLIGVGDYSDSDLDSLMGPENDVELVRRVLKARFGIPDKNIKVLLNKQATHSAVQRAFADLSQRVHPGDFVYIHYAGHGSTKENKNERSGEDQTWVTFGARNKKLREPDNRDVRDKDINGWLQPLYKKTDDIVFVSDSCHSGTVARMAKDGKFASTREVLSDPTPYPEIVGAVEPSAALPGVRIGAARDHESAIEVDTRDGRRCTEPKYCAGVFTWNWVKALEQARPGERWEDVFKRTFTLVTADRYSAQRPQLEGHGDRPVFGGEFSASKARVAVTHVDKDKGTATLDAGVTTGVTKGSIFQLYDAEKANQSDLPELEIIDVTPFASEAKIQKGVVQPGALLTEVSHAYTFKPIRLFVSGDFAQDLDKPVLERIETALQSLQGFELVSSRGQADWLVYVLRPKKEDNDQYVKSKRERLPASFPDQSPEVWVISANEELLHDKMRLSFKDWDQGMRALRTNLSTYAWTQQLRQLQASSPIRPISIKISLLRPDPGCVQDCAYLPRDQKKKEPHTKVGDYSLTDAKVQVKLGDVFTFALTNDDSKRSWYAYLLNIGPDGKIFRVFPPRQDNEDEARFKAGEHRDVGFRGAIRFNQIGLETVKLIVTSNPIDVRLLENEQGFVARGNLNPLERLLQGADRRRAQPIGDGTVGDWGTVQADFEVPGN